MNEGMVFNQKEITNNASLFTKTNNNIVKKDNLFLIRDLYVSLLKLCMINKEAQPILDSFLQLVDLNDDLILLIFENASIDVRFHRLGFKVIEPEYQNNMSVKSGEFNAASRELSLAVTSLIFTTLIHEMVHACVFFIFKPSKTYMSASVPYAQKQTFFKASEEEFNPAELKFRQCVREDRQRLTANGDMDFLFSPTIDSANFSQDFHARAAMLKFSLVHFFTNIETAYQSDIFSEKVLSEIFPFYMEVRVTLFQLAKDYKIESQVAMEVLQRNLPRLHDYFETDMKRILKHRLRFFIENYGLYESKSLSFPLSPFKEIKASGSMYQGDLDKLIRGFWYEHMQEINHLTPNVPSMQFKRL